MRLRWGLVPVAIVATMGVTAAAAFGATIMVDSDGAATRTNCAAGAPGSAFLTIQGGVNAASPGDTVKVCGEPTPYAAATVATHGVTLVGVNNPIVEGGSGNNGLTLNADKVTVKGFEIRNSAAAILTNPNFSGYQISNNNLHDNSIGIFLGSDGTFRSFITHNNIHDNNAPGGGSGNGIDSEAPASNVNITGNQFANNDNEGILINPQTGADSGFNIINNTFSQDSNSDVAFLQTVNNSKIVRNTMTNTAADPINGNSSIFIGADSHADTVAQNTIRNANFNGLAVRDTAHGITVTRNTISGAGNNGIDVSSTAVDAVNASGNKITSSQQIGINFQVGTTGSNLTGNHSTLSGGLFNCQDQGTNNWLNNTAAPSSPVGICT